ncbi:MAG: Hsp70 family protein [Deltaproteobacteria bacterium]|nr:Hsp70 family protein [Deltaproteobacteria bacterium]
MARTRVIGIDLGTTFSCAAVVERGAPQVVRSRLGYTTIPSIVTFDDRGEPVVGQLAERRMILQPQETIYGSKRLLGRRFGPEIEERYQPHFQYQLAPDDDGFVAARVGGRIVSLVEVAALILSEMRSTAEASLGEQVSRAVVTVPAYFNENQRALVRQAAQRAKLEIIRIVNEPTAAALCFGHGRDAKQRLLVYDLGGGTFDVSVLDLDGSIYTVTGVDGDTFLGGIDFDRRIVDWLTGRLAQRLHRPVAPDAVGLARLRVAAQEAKHQLSSQQNTVVSLARLKLGDGAVLDVTGKLTREEFDRLTQDLVEHTVAVVTRCLNKLGLTPAAIDEVLLVGGQTRMPLVQHRLKELFGKEPSRRIHPDEVVAQGAALVADSHDRFDAAVLLDVAPQPIGIADPDGRFVPVIPGNTPVPHEATAKVTLPPGAAQVKLAVFQGDAARAVANEYLGTLVIDELRAAAHPIDCELKFRLDAENLLTVHAIVPQAGLDREVQLVTRQTPDQVLAEMGRERIRVAIPPTRQAAPHTTARSEPLSVSGVEPGPSARSAPHTATGAPATTRPAHAAALRSVGSARLDVVKESWFRRLLRRLRGG